MLRDTVPILALIDRKSADHPVCTQVFRAARKPVISTWACFAEAMYLLQRGGGLQWQENLWSMHRRGVLMLHHHSDSEFSRMQILMRRYGNVPMDFADATLVSAAESTGDRRIFTLDNDFRIYRFDDGGYFDVMP